MSRANINPSQGRAVTYDRENKNTMGERTVPSINDGTNVDVQNWTATGTRMKLDLYFTPYTHTHNQLKIDEASECKTCDHRTPKVSLGDDFFF